MKRLFSTTALNRLYCDRSGNFAILAGVAIFVLMMSGGIAVDFTRAITERSAMSNALDAAVLATARTISDGKIIMDGPNGVKKAEDFLRQMFIANMNVSDEEAVRYRIQNVQFDDATKTLTADATYDFETMFRFFGAANAQTISTNAAATYGSSDAEIAMTFDVTGSMADRNKLADLKVAAIAGIESLMTKNRPGDEKVRISSVPYSVAVNAGDLSRYVWPDDGRSTSGTITLEERENAMESGETGDPGDGGASRPGPPDHAKGGGKGKGKGKDKGKGGKDKSAGGDAVAGAGADNPDDCATERKGDDLIYSSLGPDAGLVNRDGRLPTEMCPSAAIIPLTVDQEELTSSIESFTPIGSTAGHIGIQWAWYMLSPHWAPYLPEGSKPLDPEDPDVDVRKYAIIMTDGEFNTAFAGSSEKEPHKAQRDREVSAAHARALCSGMKAEGIEIFTIGFGLGTNTEGQNAIALLKDCATPDRGTIKYFYDASTSADLEAAYADIASTIQALRLVR